MESLILALTMACAVGAPTPLLAADTTKREQTRAEYIQKAKVELDELGVKIDALELKASKAGTAAKAGIDEKLAALKARRKTAKKDFTKLKRASGKAWLSLKTGVDKGIEELKAAYDEAAQD